MKNNLKIFSYFTLIFTLLFPFVIYIIESQSLMFYFDQNRLSPNGIPYASRRFNVDFLMVIFDFDNVIAQFPFIILTAFAISGWALLFTPIRVESSNKKSQITSELSLKISTKKIEKYLKRSGLFSLILVIICIIFSLLRIGWAHPEGGGEISNLYLGWGDTFAANILVPALLLIFGVGSLIWILGQVFSLKGFQPVQLHTKTFRLNGLKCLFLSISILFLLILIEPVTWVEITADTASLFAFLGLIDVFLANTILLFLYQKISRSNEKDEKENLNSVNTQNLKKNPKFWNNSFKKSVLLMFIWIVILILIYVFLFSVQYHVGLYAYPFRVFQNMIPALLISSLSVFFYCMGIKHKGKSVKNGERKKVGIQNSNENENKKEIENGKENENNKEKITFPAPKNNKIIDMVQKIHNSALNINLKQSKAIFLILFLLVGILIFPIVNYQIQNEPSQILINQIGYLPSSPKVALIQVPKDSLSLEDNKFPESYSNLIWELWDSEDTKIDTGKVEYKGSQWNYYYWQANFTHIKASGNYSLVVNMPLGKIQSPSIRIGQNVWDKTLEYIYLTFTYQRCGSSVNNLVPEYFGHRACHLDDAIFDENNTRVRTVLGGYHSAGDYHKHTLNGLHIDGVLHSLLWSYENLKNSNDPQKQLFYDYCKTRIGNGLGAGIGFDGGYGNVTGEGRNDSSFYVDGTQYPNNQNAGSDGSQTVDIIDEALYAADYLMQIITSDGAVLGSIQKNTFDFTPPDFDTDNVPGTPDDRYNEHVGAVHARTGNLTIRDVLETAIIATGLAKLVLQAPNGYAPGGSATDPYAGNPVEWLKTVEIMRNMQIMPRMNINNTGHLIHTILLDWTLYQITNNESYNTNAENLAQRFLDVFDSNIKMSHLGDPDRELGLFLHWIKDENKTQFLSDTIELMNDRYEKKWLPQSKIARAGEVPIFGIDAIDSCYFTPRNPSDFRGGINSQYFATAFASLTMYNMTNNITWLNLAMDHMDWLAGRNPFGICMIDGAGEKHTPTYHNLNGFDYKNPRGAIPGAIPNGIAKKVVYDINGKETYVDEPSFDTRETTFFHNNAQVYSSEYWIVHNVNAMYTISTMYRYLN
jgi:Glycosyl hydrolase family 9/Cellulase N-terminal ig-like domain